MRLLVTRPEPEARETAARLEGLGHRVLVQPLTHIEFARQPEALGSPAAIVFTSRNAVRAVERWPLSRNWHGLPAFAVGTATADAARQAGFTDLRVGDGDGARLAERMLAEFEGSSGTILYPAARDRSGDLATMLGGRGVMVTVVEAYRAVAAERFAQTVLDRLLAEDIGGVLFYSRRSASVFVDLAGRESVSGKLSKAVMLALSERVAEPLGVLAVKEIRIAGRPEEAVLFDLIPPPGQGWPGGDSPSIKAGKV